MDYIWVLFGTWLYLMIGLTMLMVTTIKRNIKDPSFGECFHWSFFWPFMVGSLLHLVKNGKKLVKNGKQRGCSTQHLDD